MKRSIFLGALVLYALVASALSISESDALAATSYKRGQRAVVYVYVTNRAITCTHPENFTATDNVTEPIDCVKYTPDVWSKAVFLPYVDEMTRLEIPNTYVTSLNGSLGWGPDPNQNRSFVNVYLQITQGGVTYKTTPKQYTSGSYTVGAWSAYVRLNKGKVTGIYWDDGCQECSGSQCLTNDCGIPQKTCAKNPGACDMKFYLGWVGTDNAGWQCTSAGELPTRLRVFSLGQIYQQAAGVPSSDFIL